MKNILNHYLLSYLICGLGLISCILCIHDCIQDKEVVNKIINYFKGVLNFIIFIGYLIKGIIYHLKDYFNKYSLTININNIKNT